MAREIDVALTAEEILRTCERAGLEVRFTRPHRTKPGSRHWHLAFPATPGTLELTEWRGRVWLTVRPGWDGGWVADFAEALAAGEVATAPPASVSPAAAGGPRNAGRAPRAVLGRRARAPRA